ncbi:MAG TPA: hypothetical protein VMY37_10125 [Thermoguttaceae bacterium]|nr:hypothetical protein [Thermoguttaceae bacterium]
MPGTIRRTRWPGYRALPALVLVASVPAASRGQVVEQIREDVRGVSTGSSDTSAPSSGSPGDDDQGDSRPRRRRRDYDGYDDDGYGDAKGWTGLIIVSAYTVTSPFWGPHAILEDEFLSYEYFPRFPYDQVPGYMMCSPCDSLEPDPACEVDPLRSEGWPTRPRTWAARFRMEYADEFNDLQRIGGHLLLETRSRFGLDTETSYLEEELPDGTQDALWLGDCNVVYRFAQGEYAQFRAGVGFNWLDDPEETDFGFNFTYGADLFPRRPWVLSATIDWGTLGEAELFRFRTTGGVVVHGVELYTGYEYLDIDSTQMNGIMGGVRIWF